MRDKIIQNFYKAIGLISFSMLTYSVIDSTISANVNKNYQLAQDQKINKLLDNQEEVKQISELILSQVKEDKIPQDKLQEMLNNDQLIKVINKILGDSDKQEFIGSDVFNNLLQFFQSLTVEQNLAVMNISASIFILLNMCSLLTVFFSEYLIKTYNIETRFPRIGRYIQLRRKFYKYYYTINSIVIIIISITTIFVSSLIFIY